MGGSNEIFKKYSVFVKGLCLYVKLNRLTTFFDDRVNNLKYNNVLMASINIFLYLQQQIYEVTAIPYLGI